MKIKGKEEYQNWQKKSCIIMASVSVILGEEQAHETSYPREFCYISSKK